MRMYGHHWTGERAQKGGNVEISRARAAARTRIPVTRVRNYGNKCHDKSFPACRKSRLNNIRSFRITRTRIRDRKRPGYSCSYL